MLPEENRIDNLTSFDSLGLSHEILPAAVRSQTDWQIQTPVQALAIPQILHNKSIPIW